MSFLDNMPPDQRRLLLYGAPIVALVAGVSILKGRSSASSTATSGAGAATAAAQTQAAQAAAAAALNAAANSPAGWTMPSTNVLGTDQLATYESGVTQALQSLQQTIAQGVNQPQATTPATGTIAAPTTDQQVQSLYYSIFGRPADPSGLAFWDAKAASEGTAGVANELVYAKAHGST